jgi:signal peptidase II
MAIDEASGSAEAGSADAPEAEAPAATDPQEPAGATSTAVAGESTAARAHWFVFFGLAATVLVLDQLAKARLTSTLSPGEVMHVLGDWIRLVYSQNSGALFGLFRDNAVLFGIVSLAVIALIVVYHRQVGNSLYLSIALGLLLGGALGNMTDRLTRGFVVDFVDIGVGDFRWYTFNVADAAISLAIVMLIGAALFPRLAGPGERRSDG